MKRITYILIIAASLAPIACGTKVPADCGFPGKCPAAPKK